jgi:hypothetical protein
LRTAYGEATHLLFVIIACFIIRETRQPLCHCEPLQTAKQSRKVKNTTMKSPTIQKALLCHSCINASFRHSRTSDSFPQEAHYEECGNPRNEKTYFVIASEARQSRIYKNKKGDH